MEVISGETISIDGQDVVIPYIWEEQLTGEQELWLACRGIEVRILEKKRFGIEDLVCMS